MKIIEKFWILPDWDGGVVFYSQQVKHKIHFRTFVLFLIKVGKEKMGRDLTQLYGKHP